MERKYFMVTLIHTRRIELGLTQTQLAEKVGVSRNTISSLETGQYEPTAYTAGLICLALDCKFEDLFKFISYE